jgi:putative transposase
MPASCVLVYVHFVWATWDRAPVIAVAIEPRLYGAIRAKCLELKCEPMAIGGAEDHVHVLVRLHSTVAVATLAREMKGASSHLVSHELVGYAEGFRWQGSYGAFSVSHEHVPRV